MLKSVNFKKVVCVLTVILLAVSFLNLNLSSATSGFLSGWSYRKVLTVSQTVGADTNFQVDVLTFYGSGVDSGNNIYLNGLCQSDFDDVRFTASDGSTLLDIAGSKVFNSYNASWVIEVSANLTLAAATIYLYYGNPAASSVSNEANTFLTVVPNVLLAYPMLTNSGTNAVDASGNGNDAVFVGSGNSWVAGKFNYALSLTGSGWLDVQKSLIGANYSFTALTWFNSTVDQYKGLISQDAETGSDRQWFISQTTVNRQLGRVYDKAGTPHSFNTPSGSLGLNTWMQGGLMYDYSSGNVSLIQNGTLTVYGTSPSLIAGTPTNTRIGMHFNQFYAFVGTICYPIIVNSTLTAQQVSLIYNNYPDSTFHAGELCVRKWLASPPTVSVNADGVLPSNVGDYGFSLVQISDTQFLSTDYYGWKNLYTETCNWIVANNDSLNIKAVVHTGDITDGDSAGDWVNANTSMSVLLDNGIPYCWDAGNHDRTPANDPNGTWNGYKYLAFNSTYAATKPYWVDSVLTGKNTAMQFNYSNYGFLVINIEFLANATVFDWMTNLLDTYPDYNVIVATHSYRNSTGGYGYFSYEYDWCVTLNNTLNAYPHAFLALSGHDISGTAYNQMVGSREEIMFNRQGEDNKTGAASVRIYTFNMTDKTVHALTYKVYETPHLISDVLNDFSFNASLVAFAPMPPEPTPTPALTAEDAVGVAVALVVVFFAASVGLIVAYHKKD